jgi:hypothetical protein
MPRPTPGAQCRAPACLTFADDSECQGMLNRPRSRQDRTRPGPLRMPPPPNDHGRSRTPGHSESSAVTACRRCGGGARKPGLPLALGRSGTPAQAGSVAITARPESGWPAVTACRWCGGGPKETPARFWVLAIRNAGAGWIGGDHGETGVGLARGDGVRRCGGGAKEARPAS